MHSIATMAGVLREDPETFGLVTANGGFITKHAFGVYSTRPPAEPFRHGDLQDEVDALPSRELAADNHGPITVEAWTVMPARDGGPENRPAGRPPHAGPGGWAHKAPPHPP